jgi:uncharacterized protein YndB with AHSA1/START domain
MKSNEEYGEYRGAGEVRLVRTLPGPIERVWDYLTDPDKRSRWFAGGPIEPRKGGRLQLEFRHRNLAPNETPPEEFKEHHECAKRDCIITRWEPPRVLAYTFGSEDSEVTFELTSQGRNVLLVLTHRAQPGDQPYMTSFSAGWHTHLAHLIAQLEGAPPPPFWPLHLRLREEYAQRRAAANLT